MSNPDPLRDDELLICPNCGEPGDPGHHWLDQYGGMYVCHGADEEVSS